jgi:hypothetical protein
MDEATRHIAGDHPRSSEMEELAQIAAAASAPDFKVSVGSLNKLEQFETAVRETLERPERGKQFFELHSLEH